MVDRHERFIADEVGRLEADMLAWLPDLEQAWSLRDWATVARIYRSLAGIAERLEGRDPNARGRVVERAEAAMAELDPAGLDEAELLEWLDEPDRPNGPDGPNGLTLR
jgi:hypothetical protein